MTHQLTFADMLTLQQSLGPTSPLKSKKSAVTASTSPQPKPLCARRKRQSEMSAGLFLPRHCTTKPSPARGRPTRRALMADTVAHIQLINARRPSARTASSWVPLRRSLRPWVRRHKRLLRARPTAMADTVSATMSRTTTRTLRAGGRSSHMIDDCKSIYSCSLLLQIVLHGSGSDSSSGTIEQSRATRHSRGLRLGMKWGLHGCVMNETLVSLGDGGYGVI